jgi:hypothetical protein
MLLLSMEAYNSGLYIMPPAVKVTAFALTPWAVLQHIEMILAVVTLPTSLTPLDMAYCCH